MATSIKKGAFVLLVVLSLSSIVFIAYLNYKNAGNAPPQETPAAATTAAEYKKLKPGFSTKEELIDSLGKPLDTKVENGNEVLEYNSNNPNLNNRFIFRDSKLSFVKEVITLKDNIKISNIKAKYGVPQYALFGPGATIGFYLYIYPDRGLAYVGHSKSDLIKEIWYFPATDFESFKSRYASDYSDTIQPVQ